MVYGGGQIDQKHATTTFKWNCFSGIILGGGEIGSEIMERNIHG